MRMRDIRIFMIDELRCNSSKTITIDDEDDDG